ncbi:MAG: hypothetical protein AAFV80_20145, partial [Bacteroidota bacterium]
VYSVPGYFFSLAGYEFTFPYELPNNIDIDFIRIKTGTIRYEIISPFFQPIDVTLTIPELSLDGDVWSKTIPVSFLTNEDSFDLAGHLLIPENDTITILYEAIDPATGMEVDMDGLIGLEFEDLRHSYAEGFLGQGTYETPRDTIPVTLYENFSSGTVFFVEPRIEVSIVNSFGFPVRMTFPVIDAVVENGSTIPLGNEQLDMGIDFAFPTLAEVGASKETFFVIDADNSNLDDIIGERLTAIDYEIAPIANPDNDPDIIGFLTDTSFFSVDVELILPLYGRAQDFVFADTFEISLADLEEVDYAEFKAVMESNFPMDVFMQVYLLDNEDQLLDSLLMSPYEQVLNAAPVDVNGRTTQITSKVTTALVEEGRFRNLQLNATKAVLTGIFNTLNDGNDDIRVYSDYEIRTRLGVIGGVDPN